jgi:hypothetical protein
MALRFIPFQFQFPARSGPPASLSETFTNLGKEMRSAQVLLTGIRTGFANGDHHFGELRANVRSEVIGEGIVEVKAELALRDFSGDWDDPYGGELDCVLIVDYTNG